MASLYDYLTQRKLIALGLIFYACIIVLPVTYRIFFVLANKLDMPTASAYAALLGLPPVLLGFAKWRLGGEEPKKSERDPPEMRRGE